MLTTERNELKQRLLTLKAQPVTELTDAEQKLIGKQKAVMTEYLDILNHRLMIKA